MSASDCGKVVTDPSDLSASWVFVREWILFVGGASLAVGVLVEDVVGDGGDG